MKKKNDVRLVFIWKRYSVNLVLIVQGKQIKKGYLGVYEKEKAICDRRMEVEIDVERSEDVGNCVNREVGISGSGGTCPTRIV